MVSIISILVCLALSSTLTFLSSSESIELNGTPIIYYCTLLAFLIHLIIFIPSFIYKTEKFFDFTGSLTFLSIMIFSIYLKNSIIGSIDIHSIILSILVSIWTIRLGSFLFYRIFKTGHDPRFNELKQSFFPFLMTWTLQGMWVFICSSAALVAISSPTGVLVNNVFIVGLAGFIIGFAIEVIADNQKSKFCSDEKNRNMFINEGLWSRSRHPNYFGEIMLWTGITIMSIPSFVGLNFLALFSPIFTYLLLNHISGVRILEARGNEKWGNLIEYHLTMGYKKPFHAV